MPKPSFSSSLSSPASSRYSLATLEPGAKDVFTQGLRTSPSSLAFLASRPAATTLRGLEVLVQLVMAAMITAPSGNRPSASSALAAASMSSSAMPRSCSAEVGRRLCGLEGPAMLRTTLDRSNSSTRSYSAPSNAVAHRPVSLAYCSTSATCSGSRPVSLR